MKKINYFIAIILSCFLCDLHGLREDSAKYGRILGADGKHLVQEALRGLLYERSRNEGFENRSIRIAAKD